MHTQEVALCTPLLRLTYPSTHHVVAHRACRRRHAGRCGLDADQTVHAYQECVCHNTAVHSTLRCFTTIQHRATMPPRREHAPQRNGSRIACSHHHNNCTGGETALQGTIVSFSPGEMWHRQVHRARATRAHDDDSDRRERRERPGRDREVVGRGGACGGGRLPSRAGAVSRLVGGGALVHLLVLFLLLVDEVLLRQCDEAG
jgi:hypothetical protein